MVLLLTLTSKRIIFRGGLFACNEEFLSNLSGNFTKKISVVGRKFLFSGKQNSNWSFFVFVFFDSCNKDGGEGSEPINKHISSNNNLRACLWRHHFNLRLFLADDHTHNTSQAYTTNTKKTTSFFRFKCLRKNQGRLSPTKNMEKQKQNTCVWICSCMHN